MKYMLFCCSNEAHWNALPEKERDAIMHEYGEWVEARRADGSYVRGGKLRDTPAARTVRVAETGQIVRDGPFAETKEQIGGFHILECEDQEQAIAFARAIPTIRAGAVIEVRPMRWEH